MKKESWKKIGIVTAFAISMAFLETMIVFYLRKLYYPEGFNFPLNPLIDSGIYSLEVFREFFTIIMLVSIGLLAGRRFSEKFGYFLYSFAIWDIFYYIWLEVILNWPSSLLTWDILFLIPIPWLGPVLAPVICSLTMILFTYIIIDAEDKGKKPKIKSNEWLLLITGSLIMLFTWIYDYAKLIISGGFLPNFFNLLQDKDFQTIVSSFIPNHYSWPLFILGELLILTAIYLFFRRYKK